jgi:hypothetical protein
VIRHALALGGTVSGEHGVGVGKMEHIIVSTRPLTRHPSTIFLFLPLHSQRAGACRTRA